MSCSSLRAGLALPVGRLRQVLLPSLVLGTIPVAAELLAFSGLARLALFDRIDVAILSGFLIAAVSPAVILPVMLDQKDLGRGAARFVPDRIVAQTVVNAFIAQTGILLLVNVVCRPEEWGGVGPALALLPLSVAGGLALGAGAGLFSRLDVALPREPAALAPRRVRLIALASLVVALGVYFAGARLGLENVFATLALGVVLRRRLKPCERPLPAELRRVWLVAEIVLFVNLGSAIDLDKLSDSQLILLLLAILGGALAIRLLVAHLAGSRTALPGGELRYSTLAHVPKATIQAVFGAYPLTVFLERCGDSPGLIDDGQILVVMAVLAIVATAPPGAILLDRLAATHLSSAPETDDKGT